LQRRSPPIRAISGMMRRSSSPPAAAPASSNSMPPPAIHRSAMTPRFTPTLD
jgi:hypothetical protein